MNVFGYVGVMSFIDLKKLLPQSWIINEDDKIITALFHAKRGNHNRKAFSFPRRVEVDDVFAEAIGLYAGDGDMHRREKRHLNYVSIDSDIAVFVRRFLRDMLAVKDIVLLYALFNLSFVIAAPFVGKLGDMIGRSAIILLSYALYALMSLGFVFASQPWHVIMLFIIFGVFYSIDEAQSKAFIADIEKERRATAIGVYNFLTGAIYLPASIIAGLLWLVHPAAVFIAAAVLSFAAMVLFVIVRPAAK